MYAQNIEISTDTTVCGTLSDATSNPEVFCGGDLTKSIKFYRDCGFSPCLMGVCSIGILSDCDCNDAVFSQDGISASVFQNVKLFEH